jgi:tryptophan-rich sensory protein
MSRVNLLKLAVSIIAANLAGLIGSLFNAPAIPTWYAALNKPAFNPPNWLFGPVWTALYMLMGIAVFLVWRRGGRRPEVRIALALFGLQLVLNALWSIIFFGGHNPGLAFLEIIFLWLAILATMLRFAKISRWAALLLLPYILWVSFAAVLNYSIWQLNSGSLNDAGRLSRQSPIACTLEAKLCPDGSAVGRGGPDCEFSPCPSGEVDGASVDAPKTDEGVKLMACHDRDNIHGRDEEFIPCRQDADCTPAKMISFCAPAEVGFFECGDRDFCGADGFCRHDCRLGPTF